LTFVLVLLLSWSWEAARAAENSSFLPVDQVHAGMLGTGCSVFRGTRIDTFHAEILGVVHNGLGPRRDLILARLSGCHLVATGLVRGMSGSPVYVEGRLIGAVAYGWSFAKTPICGITPIGQMYHVLEHSLRTQRLPEAPESIHLDGNALHLSDPELQHRFATEGGLDMEPLATPVWVAGLSGDALAVLRELLDARGMQVLAGPGGTASESAAPLTPGAALGVQLVRGDMSVTGIGTVTYVGQGRVLGFGHPLMLLGETDLPLTAAHIYTIIPSLYSSFKLGAATRMVGALRQDRAQGIAGLLGQTATMLPVRVFVDAPDEHGEYHFRVAPHPDLAAGLVRVVVLGALESRAKFLGDATVDLETEVELHDGRTIHRRQVFSGSAALLRVGLSAANPLALMLGSRYEDLRPVAIDFHFAFRETLSVAEIRSVRISPNPVHPGDALAIRITLQPRGQALRDTTVNARVPSTLMPGPLTVRVGGGEAAAMIVERLG